MSKVSGSESATLFEIKITKNLSILLILIRNWYVKDKGDKDWSRHYDSSDS